MNIHAWYVVCMERRLRARTRRNGLTHPHMFVYALEPEHYVFSEHYLQINNLRRNIARNIRRCFGTLQVTVAYLGQFSAQT